MALFGYSAPSAADTQGLDPALMKQIAANSAYWSGVTDASNNAPPASSQTQDQSSPPTLKAGPLDYIMGAIFNHASPLEINAQVNAANQNAAMARARMAALQGGLSSFGSAWGGQGGGSSQPISDSPSPAVGGMIGSQAPTMPVNGGSYAGVPTMAALTPSIARIAMMNPDLAKILQKQAEDAQPNYQIVNGRRVISNDASAPSVVAPADDGLTSYVTDPSAPNGYRAVATPNAAAVKASAGALADLAKAQVAPPTAGAQATGLTYDPVSGLPRATGYTLAPGVASILATQAGAKAQAEKAAEAQYAGPIANAQEDAKSNHAGATAYGTKVGDANADRLSQARSDLAATEEKRSALNALLNASDHAGAGSFNVVSGGLARAFQTLTGQSIPKQASQQTFEALAPTLYTQIPGLQVRNEREFQLAKSRVPTLAQDPVARRRTIQFAIAQNEQKAREAKIIENFAARAQGGLNGTLGSINGAPATVDDYINESRARNPLTY